MSNKTSKKRGPNKIGNRVGFVNKKAHKEFVKKTGSAITVEQYKEIINESLLEIREYILENELGFKLPANLGYIAVNKFKQLDDYVVIDWQSTKKYKKVIPVVNLHSFGYMFKIQFFKNKSIRPLDVYFMNAHRHFKRALSKKIKAGEQNYMKLDNSFFTKRFRINNIFKNSE